ncbi:Tetratricopeptide repeat [Arabidopsis thaliana x Arabidopsis arenosa]|jgi:tetratricopeptide (TPR) repeat protein|nr:Tetratricopeptide repeat (TPR)-like superfamily protein [Arabidopsis thaliana]ANM67905.1 Tetratricopeptide repeat (TPR)-like superfamily protein [Arabidopsis thaliana]KAG7618761.1 Tetratricopeptide repeat [Arabidopsis thaliana x Arabidopsis arenosa]|eukprot:NP_001329700.1 Tetratricopeptide repeat (TPR)-like superfamily protein [Arabidopsis thaliana]
MATATATSERFELAKHCSSRNWSKAIRVLDSLLAKESSILDICNRAFCYNQLELHKHVIKDCDKALLLEPFAIQAFILKGRALLALGRKQEAVLVLEQGYKSALQQTADVKQLLELEELLKDARREIDGILKSHATESPQETPAYHSEKSDEKSDKLDNHESGASSNGNSHESSSELGEQSKIVSFSKVASKASKQSDGNSDLCNGSVYKEKENGKCGSQINGYYESCKPCNGSDLHDNLAESSDRFGELSINGNKISIKSSKMSHKAEARCGISDESRKNKKYTIARISGTHSISVDFRLSRGIAQVNEGNYTKAISIFDKVLKEEPTYPEALIGRGTAYAFQRELESAIADFTKAIQSNPAASEAWKRRGQARAALGEYVEAVEDLTKALVFEPNSPDVLHERGIVNFKSKDFTAAVKDLSICLKQEKDNKSAYTYLGLAFASLGEYKKAEEAHLKSIQLDSNYLEAWLHLAQFYQELADHCKALECIEQVLQVDNRVWKAYHLRGLVFHGLGEHRKAIQELSIGLSIENTIECLYLRGSCYHAVGEYRDAVKDYDATVDVELDAVEKFVLQCLAFYQKELALYTASKVSSEFLCFDIDGDIDPMFKEYWCKRLHPKNVCEKVYRQPPLRESLKKGKLKKQDLAITKQKANILRFADLIGKRIQYDCPGFLPNKRQHRMAGLAVIEIAQKVSKAWRIEWRNSTKGTTKNGKKNRRRERTNILSQNRGGAGCSSSSFSETSTGYASLEDRSSGRSILSWQDVYSPAVRWRQISEPCDPVVWVNKLSEEFNSGFGSHTPMVLGQAKVVRYFPNYERTLTLAKSIIKDKLSVRSKKDKVIDLSKDEKIEKIMRAETCDELHNIVGEDFWVATWCDSTGSEGKRLEGTRITCIQKP